MFGSNQKITSTVSPASELDPLLSASPRYPDNSYYPNNWGTNSSYSNNYNYYNTPPSNQNQYLSPSGPTMVLYPSLYSTVNQNQIHLHLHGSTEKLDQYFNPEALTNVLTPVRNADNEIMPLATSVHEMQDQKHEANVLAHSQPIDQPTTTDPSSVWRPY